VCTILDKLQKYISELEEGGSKEVKRRNYFEGKLMPILRLFTFKTYIMFKNILLFFIKTYGFCVNGIACFCL